MAGKITHKVTLASLSGAPRGNRSKSSGSAFNNDVARSLRRVTEQKYPAATTK